MAIGSNEPGNVATAGERIWIKLENVNKIFYDVKVFERVKDYTYVDINASDTSCMERHHLLQHFLKDALFENNKFIDTQIDTSLCEIS